MGQEKNKGRNDFLKFDENDHSTYPHLWDTMNAVLRRNFIAQKCLHKEVWGKSHITELTDI